MTNQHLGDPLQDARLGDVLAREQIVLGVELETAEIKNHPDMQRRQEEPSDQNNDADDHDLAHQHRLIGRERGDRHGERDPA
jgi:hypothetical protein